MLDNDNFCVILWYFLHYFLHTLLNCIKSKIVLQIFFCRLHTVTTMTLWSGQNNFKKYFWTRYFLDFQNVLESYTKITIPNISTSQCKCRSVLKLWKTWVLVYLAAKLDLTDRFLHSGNDLEREIFCIIHFGNPGDRLIEPCKICCYLDTYIILIRLYRG